MVESQSGAPLGEAEVTFYYDSKFLKDVLLQMYNDYDEMSRCMYGATGNSGNGEGSCSYGQNQSDTSNSGSGWGNGGKLSLLELVYISSASREGREF